MTPVEEVKAAVLNALEHRDEADRVELASLRKGYAGTQNAVVYLTKEGLKAKLLQARHIRIGLPLCRIMADRQVDTCFKCWIRSKNMQGARPQQNL